MRFSDCIDIVGFKPEAFEGTRRYISTGALDINDIEEKSVELVTYENRPSRADLMGKPGDLVFAKMAATNKVLILDNKTANNIYSTGFFIVRPKRNIINEKCLFYLLGSRMFQKQKDKYSVGATQRTITNKGLDSIVVNIPDVNIQDLIVGQFDCVSKAIRIRKEQIRLLDTLIKARFVEMFGDMLLNTMGWKEARLNALADIVSGITIGRKVKTTELYEVPYMAVSNVKDGYIDWTTVKTIMATQAEIDQYRLMPKDVLMTEGGDPDKVGRGAVIHKPPKDCIHQNHIFRVRLSLIEVLPEYMEQYLQQQRTKRYFLGCAKQTTGIASINMKQLAALPVLVPPMELQNQFAVFVNQTDKLKVVSKKSLSRIHL